MSQVQSKLSWFHEKLEDFEEEFGLEKLNPEKLEDDSLVLWNISSNDLIREDLLDHSFDQKQLNFPVKQQGEPTIIEDILLVGAVSHCCLQKDEGIVAAFNDCVEKAQSFGVTLERKTEDEISSHWETLKAERKQVNGIWALYRVWKIVFNRNGSFFPVMRPQDDITEAVEIERLIDIIRQLKCESRRLHIA